MAVATALPMGNVPHSGNYAASLYLHGIDRGIPEYGAREALI
jgi:hypothetical protein